ncbi:hypothetical protein AOLI_G00080120 [Acnodon oligacanthus]
MESGQPVSQSRTKPMRGTPTRETEPGENRTDKDRVTGGESDEEKEEHLVRHRAVTRTPAGQFGLTRRSPLRSLRSHPQPGSSPSHRTGRVCMAACVRCVRCVRCWVLGADLSALRKTRYRGAVLSPPTPQTPPPALGLAGAERRQAGHVRIRVGIAGRCYTAAAARRVVMKSLAANQKKAHSSEEKR